jgi:hypothetical protein
MVSELLEDRMLQIPNRNKRVEVEGGKDGGVEGGEGLDYNEMLEQTNGYAGVVGLGATATDLAVNKGIGSAEDMGAGLRKVVPIIEHR